MHYTTYTRSDDRAQLIKDVDEFDSVCQYKISRDYIVDSFDDEQLLFIVVAKNRSKRILSFVIVTSEFDTNGRQYGFIKLICSAPQTDRTKRTYNASGKHLLLYVENKLKNDYDFDRVSLHALRKAEGFYKYLGYCYKRPEDIDTSKTELCLVDDGAEVVMSKKLETEGEDRENDDTMLSKKLNNKKCTTHELINRQVSVCDGSTTQHGTITGVWKMPTAVGTIFNATIRYDDNTEENIDPGMIGSDEPDVPHFSDGITCTISYLSSRINHVERYLESVTSNSW